jgi:hypothetical protein
MVGITAAQCALGFRTATLMLRIGVKEDSFESFISDVYNRCKDIGLSPQNIVFHLAKLVNSLKQYEYDVDNVMNEFLDLEGLRLQYHLLQETLPSFESKKEELKRECSTLNTWIAIHKQVLSKYHDLEVMGFGLTVSLDNR